MKKLLLTIILSLAFLLYTPPQSQAASPFLPPSLHLAQVVPIYYKWEPSVKAYFIILNNVSTVKYEVTYLSNEVPQGITGTINVTNKKNIFKDFYLGTCSANSCVAHTGIKNLALKATFTYKDGYVEIKNYNL